MHKRLSVRLWRSIDAAIAAAFAARPRKPGAAWRVYVLEPAPALRFVGVRRHERAGGGFVFTLGASRGALPDMYDVPLASVPPTWTGEWLHLEAGALGAAACQVDVDLDWQTPSAPLVAAAVAHPDAAWLFPQLGIEGARNHHLLSWEILETLGVAVPDEEFEPVATRFEARMREFVLAQLQPAVARLRALSPGMGQ
jgi:hypothetical protein